jgi:hypothetical protein
VLNVYADAEMVSSSVLIIVIVVVVIVLMDVEYAACSVCTS